MIILQKKKILLCIGLVMVSLLAAGTYQIRNDERTVQTVSLPVSNKVIVVDAGHGVPDEGDLKLTQHIKQLIFTVK